MTDFEMAKIYRDNLLSFMRENHERFPCATELIMLFPSWTEIERREWATSLSKLITVNWMRGITIAECAKDIEDCAERAKSNALIKMFDLIFGERIIKC